MSPRKIGVLAFVLVAIGLMLLGFTVRNEWKTPVVILDLVLTGLGEGSLLTLLFNLMVALSRSELAGDVGALRGLANNLSTALGTGFASVVAVALLSIYVTAVLNRSTIPASLKGEVDLDNVNFVTNTRLKETDDRAGARVADLVPSAVLLIVGILCVAAALVTGLRKPRRAAAPVRWVAALRRVSTPAAFGIGAFMVGVSMKQWFVTTGAVAVIGKAQLGLSQVVLAYLYFAIAAQSLILAPVILAAVAPARAPRLLTAAQGWMDRNKRGIGIAVSLAFGVWLIWQGIT